MGNDGSRVYVVVNCAMSADGKIASFERKQMRISDERDMARVHRLRASVDAVLVGVGTILADDPHLTVKWEHAGGGKRGDNPLRVVLDTHGRSPPDARVFDGSTRTIVYTCNPDAWFMDVDGKGKTGVEGVVVDMEDGHVSVRDVVADLAGRGVRRLLVEGGGETIWSFFNAGLVDEYSVFVGNIIVGGRDAPTPVDGEGFPGQSPVGLSLLEVHRSSCGVLLRYRVSKRELSER